MSAIETLLVYAAWHPDHGYNVRNISEMAEDVVYHLGSNMLSEGWKARPVWLTFDPYEKAPA